jgi:hypothetical protein
MVTAMPEPTQPSRTLPGLGQQEFQLEIWGPTTPPPVAIVWFTAATASAAICQARRFVDAHDGSPQRFGELYARDGDNAEYLDVIEPSTPATETTPDSEREQS